MKLVIDTPAGSDTRVSFVLLDWSCRESLHILDYLNDQTVARDQYEIIWIEFYDNRSAELDRRIAAARAGGTHAPVDVYAILGMPQSVYYHKHLLYNVGIVVSHGRIVCFCDSDAFMQPTFVESIVRAFEADPNIVLHMDEVRNNDRQFYPFDYPNFDDVVGPGCANWLNGRPTGISGQLDPLHTRNYGACMCALRSDLIAIGGADMHLDYLGHICGPYELTFRLVNAGKREVWHADEWLYHVWHPGQAGDRNYAGPHDGKHMSTTALAARDTGRIEPLTPHPAIGRLRNSAVVINGDGLRLALAHRALNVNGVASLDDLIVPRWLQEWDMRDVDTKAQSYRLGRNAIALLERAPVEPVAATCTPPTSAVRRLGGLARMQLLPLVFGLLCRQFQVKFRTAQLRVPPPDTMAAVHEPFRKVRAVWRFARRMLDYNHHLFSVCWRHLCYVAALGHSEVVLYGDGDAARILGALSTAARVRVRAVCPLEGLTSLGAAPEAWSEDRLRAYDGMVIVAAFVNTAQHVRHLQQLGFDRNRLVVLE